MSGLQDRRVVLGLGALAAVAVGGVAALMLGRGEAPSTTPPPASEGGLQIEVGENQRATLDPSKPLRCFVDGKFVGLAPLAEATPSIRSILQNQKRVAAGKAEAEKMLAEIRQGRTLEQVAQQRGLTVQRSQPFTRVDANPVFGQANAAVGAAFGTPIGRVGPVAATPAAVFLVRPVSRTQADRRAWEQQKTAQRQQAQQQLQQDLFGQWLSDARENAKIEDNRAEMARRSRASQQQVPI